MYIMIMQDLGADDGTRDFLKHTNSQLNSQTNRPKLQTTKGEDLIFMQIDADCDMLSQHYSKILFLYNIILCFRKGN